MKALLSLSALLITLTLTAQSNTATWYLNDTSGNGIQSDTNTASGIRSTAMGNYTTASGVISTAMGGGSKASGKWSTAMGYDALASGDGSLAAGIYVNASGVYSTAVGLFTTSSGYASTAIGDYTTASGMRSTAMGVNSKASGNISTAMGYQTEASGGSSTAMGSFTTASGENSTALGTYTSASGYNSTAMGYYTTASDYASTVIGRYNSSGSSATSADSFDQSNTAFVIGNGTENQRRDALTVLFDGTTNVAGSVTATEFIGDGSQLTNINYDNITFPIWRKGEAGGVEFGSSEASGYMAVAMGYDGVFASGWNSTAMGHSSGASGDRSTAMGAHTRASGNTSTAMGQATTAIGDVSISMGDYTTASDYNSLVVGRYNLLGSIVTNSATEFSLENTAFVIGNGSGWDSSAQQTNRSDALTVLFDGTTTIAGDLSINSDARLKANIISLGSTLAKLLKIDGKRYTMKKDENKKQKIGLLAQDIEKVFPELVSESNGVKSVNYQGLVPVLINALKEQDTKLNKQQAEINRLKEQEARIERLEKLLLDS